MLVLFAAGAGAAPAQKASLPHLVERDGHHALIVDGAPYLMLGAQVNNSSGWPAMMPKIWPAIEYLHANTVEIPVYWEVVEPEEGKFDFSSVDVLLSEARKHNVHLVLLWFGTWKNGSSHYMPLWMKAQPEKYPRLIGAHGSPIDSPSPVVQAPLDADIAAFSALMGHLKNADRQHTVLMVQVENEPGTWGSIRDYSPAAQKLFESAVPPEILTAMGARSANGGSWSQAFGEHADEYFHAWCVAHFIGQVAAAGKAIYPLPMYANAALRDPLKPSAPGTYEMGGPTDNFIPIWKAAAPALDILAPDIYTTDTTLYQKYLELYGRPDNPLFVPETGSGPNYARYCFSAIGHGAIGFSPFGIDFTSLRHGEDDAARKAWLDPFAANYEVLGPMAREIAQLNFDGKLQAVAEPDGGAARTLLFGPWTATVTFDAPTFGNGPAKPHPDPAGRAIVAQLGTDRFLVTGYHCRVDFKPTTTSSTKQREFVRVEEGAYANGVWSTARYWNGDQTDWGLNFSALPQVLQVQLGTY